jgi:ubiquinone/menaquinone biosynthesis C-methylase UbiE
MDDDVSRLSRAFGPVAEAYDRGRPDFPREAAAWLVGREAATVVELGAGTGKLTRQLVALGHDVHATDPDAAMLAVLQRHLPDVPTSVSGAEEIPLPDRSVDVVVAGQAFHWFDHERALPEIARVLRPGGYLALAWNLRDERIPWVRKLGRALGSAAPGSGAVEDADSTDAVVQSDLFGFVEDRTFSFWQGVDRDTILDMAVSRSYVATLDEDARQATLDAVRALYDDYGRGMDGMQIPYDCRCFRAVVTDRPGEAIDDHADDDPVVRAPDGPSGPSDGTDTDMLLIDFR